MKYFKPEEFQCHHCGSLPEAGMNPVLLSKLDKLREMVQAPIIVTSGFRCPTHNARVGGVTNSQHTKGNAADIICPSIGVDALYESAKKIGFDGIGFYPDAEFVHVDCRDNGESPCGYLW